MIATAVLLASASGFALAGGFLARRSRRAATAAGGAMLALILVKLVAGRTPALEPRLFPWDWYPRVELWWHLLGGMFLFGAGLYVVRASLWKRDLLMVATGLLASYLAAAGWSLRGDHTRLCGTVDRWGVCLQTSPYSCGPASAAALLRLHGVSATEREMADLCLTRPGNTLVSGTSDCGLARGLRAKLGSRSRVEVTAPRYADLPVPCLVPVRLAPRLGHCILVVEAGETGVTVIDPHRGFRTIDRPAFESSWQGSAVSIRS